MCITSRQETETFGDGARTAFWVMCAQPPSKHDCSDLLWEAIPLMAIADRSSCSPGAGQMMALIEGAQGQQTGVAGDLAAGKTGADGLMTEKEKVSCGNSPALQFIVCLCVRRFCRSCRYWDGSGRKPPEPLRLVDQNTNTFVASSVQLRRSSKVRRLMPATSAASSIPRASRQVRQAPIETPCAAKSRSIS